MLCVYTHFFLSDCVTTSFIFDEVNEFAVPRSVLVLYLCFLICPVVV